MEINIQKLNENAVIPTYANPTDAGLDLTATSKTIENGYIEYGTGLAIAIPEGYVGFLFPRSSISNTKLSLANSVGVIDAGYRGEIKLRFKPANAVRGEQLSVAVSQTTYNIGDRVGQLIIIPYPSISFMEVDTLDETARDTDGFGSTGM